MKYYAVKCGKKPGIYTDWESCKEQVLGFEGAVYKSFSTEEAAKNFLLSKEETMDNCSRPMAYVDGSFDASINKYSFGVVFMYQGKEYHFKKSFAEDELSSMRNVAGEIKGAAFIIQYCINRGIPELVVYHDYEGISKWYQNEWKANLPGTKKYQSFSADNQNKIKVEFVKVKGHSNDKYNDLADALAKAALKE